MHEKYTEWIQKNYGLQYWELQMANSLAVPNEKQATCITPERELFSKDYRNPHVHVPSIYNIIVDVT